jgi:AcrR family transcriptional regulator
MEIRTKTPLPPPGSRRDAKAKAAEAVPRTPQPARERSPRASHRDPVEGILAAAGELLDQQGYDGLSTTAVAARAGVSTATLYRLFPDKHAILRALVEQLQSERAEAAARLYDGIGAGGDWRKPLADAVREALRLRLSRPGGRSTRRALQTSPELWLWDQQHSEELARRLARAMLRRKPSIGRAKAERAALVAISASVALLDVACLDPRRSKVLIEEGIAMREAYLARYLD